MKQFALLDPTDVKVLAVNVRSEMHGKKHVPAVDIKLQLTCANTFLDSLVPGLRQALCMAATKDEPEVQPELDGVQPVTDTPVLRFTGLEPLKLADEFTGYDVTFDLGTGRKDSIVELAGAKVNAISVELLQGGSAKITYRVQASGMKEREIGKLGVLIDCQVAVIQTPPAEAETPGLSLVSA